MADIVVVGGGIGGLVAARELRRRLGRTHRVVLVDKAGRHVFQPALLWVMMGWRRPEQIQRDLGRLSRRGIDVVSEEVRELDTAAHRIVENSKQETKNLLDSQVQSVLCPSSLVSFASEVRS